MSKTGRNKNTGDCERKKEREEKEIENWNKP
jgi:hypothetical protein